MSMQSNLGKPLYAPIINEGQVGFQMLFNTGPVI